MTDTKLMLTEVEGEARIRDLELAERLGFSVPINIRNLIRRHEADLVRLGVLSTVKKTSSPAGGRPGSEFFLNRKQAIFLTAKSETAEATDITIEIIERFDAYERGAAPTALVAMSDDEVLARGLQIASNRIEALQATVAHLQPQADALDRIAGADGSHCITDAAKALQIGPKGLFD